MHCGWESRMGSHCIPFTNQDHQSVSASGLVEVIVQHAHSSFLPLLFLQVRVNDIRSERILPAHLDLVHFW